MKHALCVLWSLVFSCVVALGASVPKLNGYRINDHANLLSEDQRTALESKLEAYEQETSNQFALLTVESLEGDAPEEFANRTFREWGLGQKDKDNGILVLFSLGDRKLRIEVGYGLEGSVPDATASQIYREMAKLTKQNKYYEGFDLGFDSLIKATKGEYSSGASEAFASSMAGGKLMIGVVLAVIIVIVGACSQSWGAATIAAVIGLLYGILGFGTFGIVVLCVIAALVIVGVGMAIGSAASSGGYGGRSGGSLFDGFSSGKSTWSPGGDGGGNFSGGGGESGGGGAGGDA
jgi:uncharacterized protein